MRAWCPFAALSRRSPVAPSALGCADMRFAISIPQYARDSRFDDGALRAHLARTEALGKFEGAWVQEQVIAAAGSLAPLRTLAYAAACTEKLRLALSHRQARLHPCR